MNRLALLAALLLGVAAARADFTYVVLDVGTLGGPDSAGNALNQGGQVTGAALPADDVGQVAFISDVNGGGPLRSLGTLGGSESFGQAIDFAGRVAGSSKIADETSFRAFLSEAHGGPLMDLGTLGGSSSYAVGVNGSGQVSGYSLIAGNSATHAFLSDAGGGILHDLGTLPGGMSSFATGVNASGQVVGQSNSSDGNRAFISEANGGALRNLGTLGGSFSFGTAINDSGQVAGRSATATIGVHAFRSGPNGGPLLDLGTLGGYSSFAQAINNNGDVVGYSYLSDQSTVHAFIYTTTTGMIDLNLRLPSGSGWVLTEARGINDRGQITGVGTFGGQTRAFLLMPVSSDFRITSTERLATGHILLKGLGTPGQSYALEESNDVRGGYLQIATVTAASDGAIQFEDFDAANFARRFYRLVAP